MELLAGAGVWIGLVIGFVAGFAVAVFLRALQDFRKTKESLPSLKKTMRGTRRRAAYRMLGLAGYAALVLVVVVYIA
jgi:uncharacterized membrane protein YjjP (DUF1212 family)